MPPPSDDPDAPLQAHVTNLDASSFLGRIALCRIRAGSIRRGQQVAWCRADGTVARVKITELLRTEALTRVPADSASAGDLVAVAGIAEVTIGDTLADPENPVALPRIAVDEPAISMTIGINTSPLVGRDPHPGTKLTARQVRNRLDTELVGNVSVRVLPTERPDTWEVQGRGELALAVLVETMRREGFELTVGKPEVVTKVIDGKLHEPFEHLSVDVPTESLGAVTQLVAARKGELSQMVHGESRVRMEYRVPSRGLIGFRTEFLTITRGAGIASHVFDGYGPWVGEINSRLRGSLIADRAGPVTGVRRRRAQRPRRAVRRPRHPGLRGHGDRRVHAQRGPRGQHRAREEADQHAQVDRGRADQADPADAPEPRAEPGVLRLGRVRRGHAGERPHPQGRARLALAGPCAGPRPRRVDLRGFRPLGPSRT